MKVVMTGGGTAGHVNPALSIAQIIKEKEEGSHIEFVGTKDRLEAKLVPKAGYKLNTIEVYGLRRSLSPQNIKTVFKAYTSYRKCRKLLSDISPDVVIGTGGYVSWPVCRAAVSLGIPTALHEANAEPGFAVKMLNSKADVIFVNFKETERSLPDKKKTKKLHVGMPIDKLFYELDGAEERKKILPPEYDRMVLSFGGSLGAEKLNRTLIEMYKMYAAEHPNVYFVHATGGRAYEGFMKEFTEAGLDRYKNIRIYEYIYDMPHQMAACDIVISRSGASTMSELASLGKPAILVPSPNVTNDQQYRNAKIFAEGNAALLIKDGELSGKTLSEALDSLLSSPKKLGEMAKSCREFAVRDTSERIYNCIKELTDSKKQ